MKGTRKAIQEAWNEIGKLNSITSAFYLGIPPKKVSRYFMDGSMMFLVKGADPKCKVEFVDCRGSFNIQHKPHQRSSLLPRFSGEKEENWVDQVCLPQITEKLKTQLGSSMVHKKEFTDTVEITTRFGSAYVVDVEGRLPKTQVTMSIDELIDSCEKGKRMRNQFERPSFQTKSKVMKSNQQPSTKEVKKVTLQPSKGKRDIEDLRKTRVRLEQKTGSLGISFSPGIFNPDLEKQEAKQVTITESVMEKVLRNLGYVEGKGDIDRLREESYWIILVTAATGFELQIGLDANAEFVYLKERNLTHVHASIFHGQKLEPTTDLLVPQHDVRFIVQTVAPVLLETDLARIVFPDGDTSKLPIRLEEGRPVFYTATEFYQDLKRRVGMVKQAVRVKHFMKGDISASIIVGKMYSGDRLDIEQRYCHLSLYFRPDQLIHAARNSSEIDDLARKYVEESLKVSSMLEKMAEEKNADIRKQGSYS